MGLNFQNLKRVFIFIAVLLFRNVGHAQISTSKSDTALVFSITIFNKQNTKALAHFPDVYPNIAKLKLISNSDTIPCYYDFPFLKMSKEGLNRIKYSKTVALSFYYAFINKNVNNKFLLLVPLKFQLTYSGAKFIVIEQYQKSKFTAKQSWGGTLYTGEQIKSVLVY